MKIPEFAWFTDRKLKLDLPIHPARMNVEQLLVDCDVKRTRGSGPGGQHRNKVETAIVITHRPTGVVGQASEKRSQEKNRQAALERLRINLALAIRNELSPCDEPSHLWQSRVKSSKIQVNVRHHDFPSLLAEALDFLVAQKFDLPATAQRLGITSSQLVKFFKSCPAAFERVNRERQSRGMKRLS